MTLKQNAAGLRSLGRTPLWFPISGVTQPYRRETGEFLPVRCRADGPR